MRKEIRILRNTLPAGNYRLFKVFSKNHFRITHNSPELLLPKCFDIVHLSSDAGRIVISLLTGRSIVVKPSPLYSVTFSPGLGFLYSTRARLTFPSSPL